MSVARAQREISSREFAEWIAVEQLAPLDDSDWQRAAMICCVIANGNRGRNQRAYKLDDFMPRQKKRKRMANDAMAGIFAAYVGAHNAAQKVKRGGGKPSS